MKRYLNSVTTLVLTFFAKLLLKKHSPKIIAITGSVGKTSTKRAVAAVVEQDFKTQWHEGNYNTAVGLPLALYEIELPKNIYNPLSWLKVFFSMISKLIFWNYPYELLVLEYGIDHPGEMDHYISFTQPDIGIVTAIQGAHLGAGLKNLDTVYKEKTKLATAAKVALVNADDKLLLNKYVKDHPHTKTYGTGDADFAGKIKQNKDGFIEIKLEKHTIKTHFIGEHSGLSLIAGWAVGDLLNIDPATRIQALEELQPYPGRMNVFDGLRGSVIIDDTYNNVSVEAAKTAIKSLLNFPVQGKRYLIIGTMNEMGKQTGAGHREVGAFLAENPVDYLVTIGQPPKDFLTPEAKKSIKNIKSYDSPYKAGAHVSKLLKKDDVVLVKGSQNGVFAEEATALLLRLESDRSKLVRQSSRWQKLKHAQFDKG